MLIADQARLITDKQSILPHIVLLTDCLVSSVIDRLESPVVRKEVASISVNNHETSPETMCLMLYLRSASATGVSGVYMNPSELRVQS